MKVRHTAAVRVGTTLPVRPRKGRAGGRKASQPRTTVRVDQRVLTAALDLADGDPSRLVIDADGSVLVRNRPRVERCSACGSTQAHHLQHVRRSGQCVV